MSTNTPGRRRGGSSSRLATLACYAVTGWTCAQHTHRRGETTMDCRRINYRYYNPSDGRWTRRDPIGIKGGFNLYKYVNNRFANNYDYLGLCKPGYEVCQAKCGDAIKCITNNVLKYRATCDCVGDSYPLSPSDYVMGIEQLYTYDVSGDNGPMTCCCKIKDDDREWEWNWEPALYFIEGLGIVLIIGAAIVILAGTASPAAAGAAGAIFVL